MAPLSPLAKSTTHQGDGWGGDTLTSYLSGNHILSCILFWGVGGNGNDYRGGGRGVGYGENCEIVHFQLL